MTDNHTKKEEFFFITTDYSIPRFGFKQSLFLITTLFITFTIGTAVVENISDRLVLPALFLVSLIIGYSISIIQFYKKRIKENQE